MERRCAWGGFELDMVGADAADFSGERAALVRVDAVDEALVVHPVHPAGEKAARERHLEFVTVGIIGCCGFLGESRIDRLAVDLADGGDVFGGFQTPLDLEAGDAEADQVGDFFHGGEVLRRKEVAALAEIAQRPIDHHPVGEAAGLGALAAIGAPLAERFAGEALSRIGDAEAPWTKTSRGGLPDSENRAISRSGKLPRQDDPRRAEPGREAGPLRRCNCHLGRGVDLDVGRDRPRQFDQPEVLDNDGVDPRRLEGEEKLLRLGQLRGGKPACSA